MNENPNAEASEESLLIDNPFRDERGGAILQVLTPKSLEGKLTKYKENGGKMLASLGNFGHINYGTQIVG